ncbi:hypothetical protein [Paracoccus beibuensis]|uniref:hypothetical protein n=1 Tax=Paracoccus beibuensis TaxID=547602 RepID=UPI002240D2D6|nr:hypothetical protein [Paracoccus beibuensis]
MASIFDTAPLSTTVEIDGKDIQVTAVGIDTLIEAIGSQAAVAHIVRSDNRAAALAAAVAAAGAKAITKILAAGLREDEKRLEKFGLAGVYQLRLLNAIAAVSVPEVERKKLVAEVLQTVAGLGMSDLFAETPAKAGRNSKNT